VIYPSSWSRVCCRLLYGLMVVRKARHGQQPRQQRVHVLTGGSELMKCGGPHRCDDGVLLRNAVLEDMPRTLLAL